LPHDRARLDAVELPPFRAAVAAGIDVVMTAHVVCRGVDPERPATLSPKLLAILRDEMRFGGMLVSDDLEMKAIGIPVGDAAVQAVAAGCDAVLVCRHDQHMEEARRALEAEARRTPAFLSRLEDAVARGVAVRRAAPPAPAPDDAALARVLDAPEHHALAAELAARLAKPPR
jgi:beta-N-acetylhexosaminidase